MLLKRNIFEASQNEVKNGLRSQRGKDDSQNKIDAAGALTATVRDYSASVLTTLEKKYLDYIKVLDKLSNIKKKGNRKNENKKDQDSESSNKDSVPQNEEENPPPPNPDEE